MHVVVLASAKGGVGKTTVSINLAHALARMGRRTLLVDVDPQGAIGLSLSRKLASLRGVSSVLDGSASLREVIVETRIPTFALVPVGRVDPLQADGFHRGLENGAIMSSLVREARADRYDVVVIDTPCGLSGATLAAIRVASMVVSPIQAEPLSLRSTRHFLEAVVRLRESGASLSTCVVLTMLRLRNGCSYEVAREVWDSFPSRLVLETYVPHDPEMVDASARGVPVGMLRTPAPPVAQCFRALGLELEQRMGIRPRQVNDEPRALLD